ncbi:MAG: hypothetical protein HZB55_22365 [Deltaproteobacteria bacterium]|nr:hypothetical protein [Deltaproteobacteria bacterium]
MSTDLKRLVEDYLRAWGNCYEEEDRWWGDRNLTWPEALTRAWRSRLRDGGMCSHQRRVAARLPEGMKKALATPTDPKKFQTFEDLYVWVASVARQVPGIGTVTTYDVAQRLGAWLGLQPTTVYLHAGTAVGAGKLNVFGPVAELSAFPPEIAKLGATHAENFLCLYKDRLSDCGKQRGPQ